jgi:intein-encoded DNA endonuclease-like protein
VVDGKKAKKPDEQKIIADMKRLKSRGKSYRYIARWLQDKKGVSYSFVGVKNIIEGS